VCVCVFVCVCVCLRVRVYGYWRRVCVFSRACRYAICQRERERENKRTNADLLHARKMHARKACEYTHREGAAGVAALLTPLGPATMGNDAPAAYTRTHTTLAHARTPARARKQAFAQQIEPAPSAPNGAAHRRPETAGGELRRAASKYVVAGQLCSRTWAAVLAHLAHAPRPRTALIARPGHRIGAGATRRAHTKSVSHSRRTRQTPPDEQRKHQPRDAERCLPPRT